MRLISLTISAFCSLNRLGMNGERGTAMRIGGEGSTPRSVASVSSNLIAKSRRFCHSSSTKGATFGMRALAFSGENSFMRVWFFPRNAP